MLGGMIQAGGTGLGVNMWVVEAMDLHEIIEREFVEMVSVQNFTGPFLPSGVCVYACVMGERMEGSLHSLTAPLSGEKPKGRGR